MFSLVITYTNDRMFTKTYNNESEALEYYELFVNVMLPVLHSLTLIRNSDLSIVKSYQESSK